jgi:hypothetical protein
LILRTNAGKRSARDLDILRTGARADANRTDTNAVDDDGQTAFEIGEAAAGRDRKLHFKLGI